MNQAELDPRSVIERAARVRSTLNEQLRAAGNVQLLALWNGWETRLIKLSEEATKRPEVEISLVGGTGAGKSTLVNALLDVRLLPVSNMRACTAAISEIAYVDASSYRATVEFVPRESWQREIDLLLADIGDARYGDEAAEGPDTLESLEIPRIARDKLWAVYRPNEDSDPATLDPRALKEPPEITHALDTGFEEFASEDLDEFRKRIIFYLDSKHRYWPIVKSVKIQGPFSALKSGAKLVDLPGINDPNEARERVTKTHLKTCRFVWIVFNAKRVLTRDTINLMGSDDFLRQVVMDGRADALTFVATASDDVDVDSGREEFGLDDDASEAEVVLARNREVQKEVTRQLEDLSFRLARLAGETSRAEALAAAFRSSKLFPVSAREYLRLKGLAKTKTAGLENVNQTQVPMLREHMQTICSRYGVEAHSLALHRQMDILLAEIKRVVYSHQVRLEQRKELSKSQQKEIEGAAEAARGFLAQKLQDLRERFAQDLESSQDLLRERLKRATDRGRSELSVVVRRWSMMHWATLRAVSRRAGAYVGSTGKHDLPADLTKPVLDSITFAWSDFFGDKLGQTLEKWTQKLINQADDHRRRLLESIRIFAASSPNLERSVSDTLVITEKVVTELLQQTKTEMESKIENVRRSLYDCIPDQVRANMRAAFERAAAESGTGMKARMVDILAKHAGEVSEVMFSDAEQAILDGVRSLNDWLCSKYVEMEETVNRHTVLAADNLTLGRDELSVTAIENERQSMLHLAKVVGSLEQTRLQN